jgi:hypothetical protein
VVESGRGRLSRIDLATGEVSTVVEALEVGSRTRSERHVSGDAGYVVYRIEGTTAARN